MSVDSASGSKRFLFYVEQDYAFDILRPLQQCARQAGHEVRWLTLENTSDRSLLAGESAITGIRAAVRYNPHAVVAPGDRVPSFIPGLKVQVFHGINEDKRGNIYPERGLFDLYCTEGPIRTAMLQPLADQHHYFRVAETGWLKLDTILNYDPPVKNHDRPQILFASTFTPLLSGAAALAQEIHRLSRNSDWQWLITLHPKTARETVATYRAMTGPNLAFFGADQVIALLHRADLMVSDNSSILQEFLILKKPVVTYRNRAPAECMIDIHDSTELQDAIDRGLEPDAELRTAIDAYGPSVTPCLDGASAPRVLAEITAMLESGWQDKKPANWWRNLKMRFQLKR